MRAKRALATLLGWACIVGCGSAPEPEVERVVLVALDGFDWKVLDRVIERGEAPNLARFVAAGRSGEISTLAPTYSPIVWATIATGKGPARHGITGFGKLASGEAGTIVPYTSNSLRTKPLWRVLGDLGERVAVVGWWTTWPAQRVNGVMVSDRMLYNRFNLWFGLARHGTDLPGQTWPEPLADELAGTAVAPTRDEIFERFAPGRPPPPMSESLHDPWYELLLAYGRDEAYRKMLDRVLQDGPFDFTAFYLNGPDIASHYFWKYEFPDEWTEPIPREELERNADVVSRYYSYVDEAIGPLLAQASERCVVIVVSDHGFVTGARSDSPSISGTHYRDAPPGVIALAGGGIPGGSELRSASILDVTPTVLHLLGHPVGRDMEGRVLAVAGTSAGPSRPVAYVDTYEDGPPTGDHEPVPSAYDAAIVEKLRALGYIGSEGAVQGGD